jgi:hypothetical protein
MLPDGTVATVTAAPSQAQTVGVTLAVTATATGGGSWVQAPTRSRGLQARACQRAIILCPSRSPGLQNHIAEFCVVSQSGGPLPGLPMPDGPSPP